MGLTCLIRVTTTEMLAQQHFTQPSGRGCRTYLVLKAEFWNNKHGRAV